MTWIYTKIDCKTTSTTSEEGTSHNHYSALVGGFPSCSKTWSSILLLTDVRKGNVHFQPRRFAVLKWYVCVCVFVCARKRERERERERVCVCVCTEWTWNMHYLGISTYQFIPYYASATSTCTHPQTIWGWQTNGAKSEYCLRKERHYL